METLDSFMERLASPSPAPGGGAASAAVSVVAASLVSMVAGLTIGKKGYENSQDTMKQVLEKSRKLTGELRSLMEEDEEAFNKLFAAWKMPKSTDDEKKRRREAMDMATRGAIQVPWKIAGTAAQILRLAATVASNGNSSAITDAGSALEFSLASIRAALQNVEINLKSLSNSEYADSERMKIRVFTDDAGEIYRNAMKDVRRRMQA
ncbi:MAG: cyclodeaminase/cyclohydrolase family protein [Thermoplasmataceae archaeon]